MLKAVRRIRSNRPVIDAVVGQPQIHAGNGKDKEEGEGESEGESEGAHGPTPPLDPKALIPDAVSEAALHDVAGRPSKASRLLGLGHGYGHVVGHGAQSHIVGIPPVQFPEGRNLYLDRPLPPPPPPKLTTASSAAALVAVPVPVPAPVTVARPIMLARPSTSSGLDSSRTSGLSAMPTFDKRLSKDDMALTTQMGMMRTKNGLQPYRVGFKGGALPTPEPSPNTMAAYSPMAAPSFVPARVMTPESLSSGEIQIGMALGSPSHASFQAGWQPQLYTQSQMQTPPQGVYSPPLLQQPQLQPQRTPEPPIQRQKTQKRRLFGLFGRKNVEPPKAADVIEANSSVVSITSNSSSSWQVDSTPGRSNTVAGKKSTKYKPLMRSGTQPDIGNAVSPLFSQESKGAAAWSNDAPQLSGPGLLDVEIPDIRLERYSIMFSGVLNQQGGAAAPASSLLARRQATLEKLKTINDKIQDEEDDKVRNKYRRATSPQPTKSPVFTLFPTTTTTTNATLAPRASSSRLRSNTSPALLPSPSKPSFEQEQYLAAEPLKSTPRKEKKTVTIVSPRTMDERFRAAQVEKLRAQQNQRPPPLQQPQTVISSGFRFGPEESALILDSPQSISDDGQNFSYTLDREVSPPPTTNPFKPNIPEPQWTMISTPTPSTASETSTKRTVLSSSESSSTLSSQITRPSSPPPVEEYDADLKAAVEISIARQISISRQQRQLLTSKTVQRSNTIASGSGNGGKGKLLVVNTAGNGKMVSRSASSPNSMAAQLASKGQGTRVAETRLGVPRLVVAEGAKRKSERIVLEG